MNLFLLINVEDFACLHISDGFKSHGVQGDTFRSDHVFVSQTIEPSSKDQGTVGLRIAERHQTMIRNHHDRGIRAGHSFVNRIHGLK
ncbi:MAG: hypothetical protein ACD_28C00295G0002 [uncultured bacterium]|nr:MAG: hypothetical protein ACD_28C00295G0002 [uncultured bacterium]